MATLLFYDDYSEGAHPAILDALRDANGGQEMGYGDDSWSRLAAERIGRAFGRDVDVHLVSGGTQANLVCLASMLHHHEGVIAAATGHIHVHETGAVEATGHKIITVDTPDGRLSPELLDLAMASHEDEHTVLPRVLFLSQATETGSVYDLDGLRALTARAREHGLLVHLDGARLAMALAATDPPMTLASLADAGVDMLYVGGTKNGGLCGEAIVIVNESLRPRFRYHMKQRGALLAKGRLIGAQFARFFDDDGLWFALGRVANQRAARLADGLQAMGVELMQEREVNQVFAVVPRPLIEELRRDFGFHTWKRGPADTDVIRLVCSWATTDAAVDQFLERTRALLGSR